MIMINQFAVLCGSYEFFNMGELIRQCLALKEKQGNVGRAYRRFLGRVFITYSGYCDGELVADFIDSSEITLTPNDYAERKHVAQQHYQNFQLHLMDLPEDYFNLVALEPVFGEYGLRVLTFGIRLTKPLDQMSVAEMRKVIEVVAILASCMEEFALSREKTLRFYCDNGLPIELEDDVVDEEEDLLSLFPSR